MLRGCFQQLNFQKCSEPVCFCTFDSEMNFFDISTSKSAPALVCFVHVDFQMCFALQPCAFFRHLNFQQWSEREVLLAFSFLTSKCASRRNDMQFFISRLATWLRTRHCSEPLFDPPEPQIIGKTRLCYLFAHLHLLSSYSFFALIFSLLLFSSLTLPTLAFPSVHTGSLGINQLDNQTWGLCFKHHGDTDSL